MALVHLRFFHPHKGQEGPEYNTLLVNVEKVQHSCAKCVRAAVQGAEQWTE